MKWPSSTAPAPYWSVCPVPEPTDVARRYDTHNERWPDEAPQPHNPFAPVEISSRSLGALSIQVVDAEIKRLLKRDPSFYYEGDFNALLHKRLDILDQMSYV